MAPKTIKKLIFDALENLSALDLEKFTRLLLDRREEPRIPRSRVEGKNFMVVTDVIVSAFCEFKGLLVTLQMLRDIDCNEDASRLGEQQLDHLASLKIHLLTFTFVSLFYFRFPP